MYYYSQDVSSWKGMQGFMKISKDVLLQPGCVQLEGYAGVYENLKGCNKKADCKYFGQWLTVTNKKARL